MSQQATVTMPNGSEWEYNEESHQYECQHVNVTTEEDEDQYGYKEEYALCHDCGTEVTTQFDWIQHYRDKQAAYSI